MVFPGDVRGFTRITASGVIGPAGKPIVIGGYVTEGDATAVGSPYFLNGQDGTGAIAFRGDNSQTAANTNRSTSMPNVMLPLGCYISFDADTVAVTAFWTLGA
jgi:hypothetical protein